MGEPEECVECYSQKDLAQLIALADQVNKRGLNTIICALSTVLKDVDSVLKKACKSKSCRCSSCSHKYDQLKKQIEDHLEEHGANEPNCCELEELELSEEKPCEGSQVCVAHMNAAQTASQVIGLSLQNNVSMTQNTATIIQAVYTQLYSHIIGCNSCSSDD